MQQALDLLNHIIEKAKIEDAKLKVKHRAETNNDLSGTSWMVWHLTLLKELLEKNLDN